MEKVKWKIISMRELIREFVKFLESIGITPIYFFTIMTIIIHYIFDRKKYSNYKKLNSGEKFYFITTIFIVFVMCVVSIIYFLQHNPLKQ